MKVKSSKSTHILFGQRGKVQSRVIYIAMIMCIVTLGALAISGGPKIEQDPRYTSSINIQNRCCDSGDGDNCHPLTEKQIAYNGAVYALLKSNATQTALDTLTPTDKTTEDGIIFINTAGGLAAKGKCSAIPTDQLVYVCKSTKAACDAKTPPLSFDVYFRVSDGAVPKAVSSCAKAPVGKQEIFLLKKPAKAETLQMETFIIKEESKSAGWVSACRP
jgi:hypothetical protein